MADIENIQVAVEPSDDGATLVITGEIDLVTSPPLRAAVDEALAGGAASLDFDLSGVSFMDSTGLGLLANASDRTAERGGTVRVLGASPTIVRLLAVSRLDTAIEVS